MLIAYYRVSTRRQGRSGLGIDAQRATVEEYARRTGQAIAREYTEVESGWCRRRPELAAAMAHARAVRGTLVVAKLDRLARNAAFLLSLVDGGVPIHFCDLPSLDGRSHVQRMILTFMAGVAEFEANRMAERSREAMAQRLARNGGRADWWRPHHALNLTAEHRRAGCQAARDVNRRLAAEYATTVGPLASAARAGRTLAAAAAALNDSGCRTRRGRRWTGANVWRFLRRASITSQV